jgi:amino acid permease
LQTLHDNTAKRWSKVVHIALAVAIVVALSLAVPGFLMFGQNTCANILNNFDPGDITVVVMRVMYIFTMAFTFPLCFFVLRHVINIFIFEGILNDYQSIHEMSLFRFLLLTLPLLAVVLGIGCFVKDLGFVLSLAGGVGAWIPSLNFTAHVD